MFWPVPLNGFGNLLVEMTKISATLPTILMPKGGSLEYFMCCIHRYFRCRHSSPGVYPTHFLMTFLISDHHRCCLIWGMSLHALYGSLPPLQSLKVPSLTVWDQGMVIYGKETCLERIWADDVVESIECSRQGWYWNKESTCFLYFAVCFPMSLVFCYLTDPWVLDVNWSLMFHYVLLVVLHDSPQYMLRQDILQIFVPMFFALESSTCLFRIHQTPIPRFGWVGWFRYSQLLSKCWRCMWMDLWFSAFTVVIFVGAPKDFFLYKELQRPISKCWILLVCVVFFLYRRTGHCGTIRHGRFIY